MDRQIFQKIGKYGKCTENYQKNKNFKKCTAVFSK